MKLVRFKKYDRKKIDETFTVVGFTEKYWKAKNDISGNIVLVRKSNLKLKGTDIQFYEIF